MRKSTHYDLDNADPITVANLRTIVVAFQNPGISYSRACELAAIKLRSRSTKNWCGRYIRQVLSGSLVPSKIFSAAIQYQINCIEKKGKLTIEFEKVTVFAPVGQVPANTIILQKPRICLSCGASFIQNSPRQLICHYCRFIDENIRILLPSE